jgi:PPOX class probable F420-dependent enzyme
MQVSEALAQFLAERHLAVLVTLRADGSPHAVPVGFTLDGSMVRVITFAGSVKARNAARGGRASITQHDGARWVTFEGEVSLSDDPEVVASAVQGYTQRYRPPKQRTDRVVVRIAIDRTLCSSALSSRT